MDVEAWAHSLATAMLIAIAILQVRKWNERIQQFAQDLRVTRY